MEDVKIYGLCLERLKSQINKARLRPTNGGRIIIENYCTCNTEDLADILELFDLEDNSNETISEKLSDLAFTASILMKADLGFERNKEGQWCLCIFLPQPAARPLTIEPETVLT